MASKTTVELVDDLDGTEAEQTVTFALRGTTYEVDLNEKNAAKLDKALEKYVAAARKVGRNSAPRGRSTSNREETAQIRTWAKDNGIEVSERGRISQSVKDAYAAR